MAARKPIVALGRRYPSVRAFADACGRNHRSINHRREQGATWDQIATYYGLQPPITKMPASWGAGWGFNQP